MEPPARGRPLDVRRRLPVFLSLCLLAEAIVGPTVWRQRAWRGYLWPGLAFLLGDPDVAGDGLLHELGDPHARAQRLGPVVDARRRGAARARPRQAAQPALGADASARARRVRPRLPAPRAEPVVLLALGPSCTTRSAGRCSPVPSSASAGGSTAVAGVQRGFRRDARRRRGAALLRPQRRADLRAPVPARGAR
jgi:hypothetical protein